MNAFACTALMAAVLVQTAPGPTEMWVEGDGVRVRAVERGAGEPVLLVHGFWDSVEISWVSTGVVDALATDRRVIALDCRGHGESDKPHDAARYGKEMVDDLRRVLDRCGVERVHLVGHSMGSHISTRFAASHPERVRTLTLVGAGAAPPFGDEGFMARVSASLRDERSLRPLIESIWPEGAPGPTDEEVAAIDGEAFKTNDPAALSAVAAAYGELAITDEEARRLTMPVVCVVGTEDPLRADAERLAGRVAGSRTVMVEGADHMSVLGRPELVDVIRAQSSGSTGARP